MRGSFSWLVGFLLVATLIGAIVGFALSGTDLLNFNTSAATARAKDQETRIESQRAEVDLEYYKAIQAARTQAEQDKLRIELEARQRELNQALDIAAERHQYELAQAQRRDAIMISLLPIAAGGGLLGLLAICGALAYYLIQAGNSRLVLAQARAIPLRQIRRACRNEIAERTTTLTVQIEQRPTPSGNGKHPPEHEFARAVQR